MEGAAKQAHATQPADEAAVSLFQICLRRLHQQAAMVFLMMTVMEGGWIKGREEIEAAAFAMA